ncbi:MAG: glucans biosynthesis glucosyltransferase MdoH [Polynucleobacter sp.]|nr:glucans biosynthesis glucosyltransferase MdoH [Polynucleobacter sp.]
MNTSAKTHSKHAIALRRILFFVLALGSGCWLLWVTHQMLSGQTSFAIHVLFLALFSITLPWMVIGFWNALIGLLLCQLSKNPLRIVLPAQMQIQNNEALHSNCAILLCIRNEETRRVVCNAEAIIGGLLKEGVDSHFHFFILSDTNDAAIAEQEQLAFLELQQKWGAQFAITYRRRESNAGYKAGNIADFCKQWGAQFQFAITLDADSYMTSSAILRLVRMMQASPTLGILQGLVIGLPSTSAFTRLFQYGMRLGMRSYTMGSAWWQADCGPYWGHNAIIRLQPFIEHCQLPILRTRSGQNRPILSHDLLEALLMRRAGYAVRVYPQEDQNWEENPPTLPEYIRRDLRWCEGNLQYIHLLTLPKLKLISRFQLLLAIFMFLGSPAWIGLITLTTVAVGLNGFSSTIVHNPYFYALISIALLMWYLPKIAGALDVLLRKNESRRFGGRLIFSINIILETLFALLMTPIAWLNHTLFIISLMLGGKGGWSTQSRDAQRIHLGEAVRQFWPHTLLGLALAAVLLSTQPQALPYGLLFFGGLIVAIPLAIFTSQPGTGYFMVRNRLLSLPEEIHPPSALAPLQLNALQMQAHLNLKKT